MLVQYTKIGSLSQEQQSRLKAIFSKAMLENMAHVQFEGFTLSASELKQYQNVWLKEVAHNTRIPLFE